MNTRVAHLDDEMLSAYLDGELPQPQAATVEAHLEGCSGCRAELDGLRRVARSLGRLERAAPPPLLAGRVQRRLALAERETGLVERLESRLRVPRFDSPLLVTFVLVVTLAVIVFLFTQGVARHQQATQQATEGAGEGTGEVAIRMAAPEEVAELLRRVERVRLDGREMVPCGAGRWCQAGTGEAPFDGVGSDSTRGAALLARYPGMAALLGHETVEAVKFVTDDGETVLLSEPGALPEPGAGQ